MGVADPGPHRRRRAQLRRHPDGRGDRAQRPLQGRRRAARAPGTCTACTATTCTSASTSRSSACPGRDREAYDRASYPFLHADRIKTPTLFLCEELDQNVPCVGAMQMYQALKSPGRTDAARDLPGRIPPRHDPELSQGPRGAVARLVRALPRRVRRRGRSASAAPGARRAAAPSRCGPRCRPCRAPRPSH